MQSSKVSVLSSDDLKSWSNDSPAAPPSPPCRARPRDSPAAAELALPSHPPHRPPPWQLASLDGHLAGPRSAGGPEGKKSASRDSQLVEPTGNRRPPTHFQAAADGEFARAGGRCCFPCVFLCDPELRAPTSRESLHPPPGRRCRRRHASRSPAVTMSSRRQRHIPGSPGRHLLAHRPPPSRSNASVLGLPPLTRPHLATRISLPSPTLRWRTSFGVRRFNPAGWAAATVAAVAD